MTVSGVDERWLAERVQLRQAGRVVLVALGGCGDARATITRKLAVLAEHCAALGRDPAEIEKTVSTRLGDGESAEQFAQRCRALDGLGVERAIVLCAGLWTAVGLATLAVARPLLDRVDRAGWPDAAHRDRPRQTAVMPDWLRTMVLIVGVLALLLTLVVGYLMWRYRIPPRGLVAMGGAALYLISPIDLVPEAILGPLGLVDDAGVVAAVVLFVYKLVKARRILADGGIELGRPGRRPPWEPDER